MTKKEPAMKQVMLAVGGVALVNQLLIQSLGIIPTLIEKSLPVTRDLQYAISQTLYIFIYLFSFMIPVAFFRLFMKNHEIQPMRLNIITDKYTPLYILGGIAVVSATALINNFVFSWADFPGNYSGAQLDKPYKLLLTFISTAVVPAVCEEFLFRGCILSNMLPYGKSAAVIGSALMFSMMHANFPQYLYTFCAGIVLALLYTETGSIWPGTFLHLFNNFAGVISDHLSSAEDYETANRIYVAFDTSLILIGAVCIIVLVFLAKGHISDKYTKAVPTFIGKPEKGTVQSVMSPTVIVFICVSLAIAAAGLVMSFFY